MGIKSRIVVVDDVPTIGELLVRFLSKKDYEVISFTKGTDALEYLKQNQADLVITDMYMPDMNGLEVIKNVRDIRINLPVILMSSYVDQEILDELKAIGIDNYLRKPFDLIALEQNIAKILLKNINK
jgi:two-component system OmpR family response regulator